MKMKILGLLAVGLLAGPMSANASYIITMDEVGGNVVASGSGSIDLAGLTLLAGTYTGINARMAPGTAIVDVGSGSMNNYRGVSGPTSFGSGLLVYATSYSGPLVGVEGPSNILHLPVGYVSTTALGTSTATWSGTFATLGITPGIYVWNWGTGGNADSLTLRIGQTQSVPEPGTLALLGLGLAGLGLSRRRKAS